MQEATNGLKICVICGKPCTGGREMTCSQSCHDKLGDLLVAQFGEFKKVVRARTNVAYKVPTREIFEKGIREQDLDRYPLWEEDSGQENPAD